MNQIRNSLLRAELNLIGAQSFQDDPGPDQQIVADQVRLDIGKRATDIRCHQAIGFGRLACKATNDEVVIQKNRPDIHVVEKVFHIVLHPGQLLDLGLQLVIDRDQFLVDRLKLLLGCLEFFVGRLQLFVGRLQFLVGRPEFFVEGLVLVDRRLQILARIGQIALERRDFVRIGRAARLATALVLKSVSLKIQEAHQQEILFGRTGNAPHTDPDVLVAAIGLDLGLALDGRGAPFRCKLDCRAQLSAQAFAGHVNHVKRRLPGRRAKVFPGVAMHEENRPLRIRHD